MKTESRIDFSMETAMHCLLVRLDEPTIRNVLDISWNHDPDSERQKTEYVNRVMNMAYTGLPKKGTEDWDALDAFLFDLDRDSMASILSEPYAGEKLEPQCVDQLAALIEMCYYFYELDLE